MTIAFRHSDGIPRRRYDSSQTPRASRMPVDTATKWTGGRVAGEMQAARSDTGSDEHSSHRGHLYFPRARRRARTKRRTRASAAGAEAGGGDWLGRRAECKIRFSAENGVAGNEQRLLSNMA